MSKPGNNACAMSNASGVFQDVRHALKPGSGARPPPSTAKNVLQIEVEPSEEHRANQRSHERRRSLRLPAAVN